MEKLILRQLKKSELFSHLPKETIQVEIMPHTQLYSFHKGAHLLTPQQHVDMLGIVLSGCIHIMHIFADGTYSIMNTIEPAEVVCADLACTKSQRSPYHATAAVPSQIIAFPAALIIQPGMIHESLRIQILIRLMTIISHENMKKEYRLAILSHKGLRDRIMTFLTMQAGRRQTTTFKIPFSREELAAFLCVNRSSLSHELSLMQQEGLISFRKNVFTLLDWDMSASQNVLDA